MANIIIPPGWRIPDREATPESVYFNRRAFLKQTALGAAAVGLGACGTEFTPTEIPDEPDLNSSCNASPPSHPLQTICPSPTADLYPASRNMAYEVLGGPAETNRIVAASFNNYYEFSSGGSTNINTIWPNVGPLQTQPWTVEVVGEAELTGTFDVYDLEREFGLEERLYRHRCVEAWSMVVPWTGYPLARLLLRGPSYGRGAERTVVCGNGDIWRAIAQATRCTMALGNPVEVRFQEPKGDGSYRVYAGATTYVLA